MTDIDRTGPRTWRH